MFKLDLEKAEEPRGQIANIHWIKKKKKGGQGNSRKTRISASLTMLNPPSVTVSHCGTNAVLSPFSKACTLSQENAFSAFSLCSSYFFLSVSQATNLLIQFIFSISSLANSTFFSAKKSFPAIPKSPLVGWTVFPKFMPSQNLRMWPDWEIGSLQI